MIVGLGLDVVEVERIRQAFERHGRRFATRILGAPELVRFADVPETAGVAFLAKRFAAKEAFAKAAGVGFGRGFGFNDVWIGNDAFGKPEIRLNPDCRALKAWSNHQILLSLSDERGVAAAVCVISR